MPSLAPGNLLPPVRDIVRLATTGRLDRDEIGAEIVRQLDRFENEAGVPPDFVDGHQHVHVLPVIRQALLATLRARFPDGGLLLRDPADRLSSILRRRVAAAKALAVRWLARGFARDADRAGFLTNIGFSGYSTFGSIAYAREFPRFLVAPGKRPMIMCHPGFADPAATADSIAARRPEEYAVLSSVAGLPEMIWHPKRQPGRDVGLWNG
jgi:predicted glycoside hydrolase/deacetylase ChbG (UPF0249 family)